MKRSTTGLRTLFQGKIEPRFCSCPSCGTAYVLWTGLDIANKSSSGSIRTYFKPNHFVPIFLNSIDVAEEAEVRSQI